MTHLLPLLAAAAVGLVLGDRIGRRRSHRQENPS